MAEFNLGAIMVTNRRICRLATAWKEDRYEEIRLELITACTWEYRSFSLLLMLAAICVLVAVLTGLIGRPLVIGPLVVLALVFWGIYSFTKLNFILIKSLGAQIKVYTHGWKPEQVKKFMTLVLDLRNKRIDEIGDDPDQALASGELIS